MLGTPIITPPRQFQVPGARGPVDSLDMDWKPSMVGNWPWEFRIADWLTTLGKIAQRLTDVDDLLRDSKKAKGILRRGKEGDVGLLLN